MVCNLAQHLNLNSLHDLAATCRQFHANLTQYRSQLVKQTLRCSNEPEETYDPRQDARTRGWNGRLTSGRVMRCARDLVAECRRCGIVVCRVRLSQTVIYPTLTRPRTVPSSNRLPVPWPSDTVDSVDPAQVLRSNCTPYIHAQQIQPHSPRPPTRPAPASAPTASTSAYPAATPSAAPTQPICAAGPGGHGTPPTSAASAQASARVKPASNAAAAPPA